MFEISEGEWYQFLGLFTGGGPGLVGTAPLFKSREGTVHFTGAAVCTTAGLLWMIFSGYWTVPILFILSAAGIQAKYGNRIFRFEAALFVNMYLTLFRIVL